MSSDPIETALKMVRGLIERLRASFATSTEEEEDPEYLFMSTWGGMSLSGTDAALYRGCRDAIIRIHGRNRETRLVSARAVEKLLTDTVLRTLRPARDGHLDPRPRFEARMKRELRRLRKGLSVQLRRWHYVVEVSGLSDRALPTQLGSVRFIRGTERNGKAIASKLPNAQSPRRISRRTQAAHLEARKKSRDAIVAMFSQNAIALVDIAAGDSAAARELGLAEVRRTVDVMNFFAPYFESGPDVVTHRAYVAPEGRGSRLRWATYDGALFVHNDETPGEWAISKFRPTSRVARRVGLTRVHTLLAAPTRTDLEERIVTAIVWAGRARAERRREQAFLFFAVALEALLTKPSARTGVTDRLRLRVVHLVHRRAEPRRILSKTVERLYTMRSSLVHSGIADDLADEDLRVIDRVVEMAILTMLTAKPFCAMKTSADFDRWFDERMLGA